MKIIFAGTTAQAARVLLHLIQGQQVVAVLTREDAPVGRKRELAPSPVAQAASALGIPTIKANRVDSQIDEQILKFNADLGVVVAFGALLKQPTLDLLNLGWLNLHYSLLPKYRGAAPVQRALLAGERETGVSIFKLDSGMDTGEIYLQVPTRIEAVENTGDLLERLTSIGITALDELLPLIAADLALTTPQSGEATAAGKLSRDDARISVQGSALFAENQVRACNPEPMAWVLYENEPMRIIDARVIQTTAIAKAGSLTNIDGRVVLALSDGSLELLVVQPAGKKQMPAIDWLRGVRQGSEIA